MQFSQLAGFFDRLEATTKRLEMTGILVELLDAADADEFGPIAYLLQGKVAPDWEGIELGLAEKMILRTLGSASGVSPADMEAGYHDAGDLGLAAEQVLDGAGAKQATLFGPEPMTVSDVYARLRAIADAAGAGSQDIKQKLLSKLLADASPLEARYIIRTVSGRARLGVADMTFLDALTAWHLGAGVRSVQEMDEDERAARDATKARLERAYDVRSDLSLIAATLAMEGIDAVDSLGIEMGVPLRPMAAERLKTVDEILAKHDGRSAVEYKYDGLRVQCHVPADPDGKVRLFSRRMEELTDQFPDVQSFLRAAHQSEAGDVIVEGECVAIDATTGRMRPFQELSRRRGRKTGLGETARAETSLSDGGASDATMMETIPVAVYLFDCLAADGASMMEQGYEHRRAAIESAFRLGDRVHLSHMVPAESPGELEAAFQEAVQDGAEGIMCKALDAPYKAGNRGFDWIKYKTDYTEDLVDTMDLVVIGAFHGRGRRGGWYGALLMAGYDPDESRWVSVCKLGTGFDDETLMGLKDRFADSVAPAQPNDVDSTMEPDVWIHPNVVMEVQAAELTLSPTHRAAWGRLKENAGLAARFPRFSGRWRDDKGPSDATTVEELIGMYQAQPEARRA